MSFDQKSKLVIIDTSQNQSWQSMGEILPSIVHDWKQAFLDMNYDVEVFTIEESKTTQLISAVMSAQLVLFTAFNLTQNKFFEMMRGKLKIDVPVGLYLHGLASVGLWPLEKWHWLSHMIPQDFLVVTSQADLNCLDAIDFKGKVFKIPFSLNRKIEINQSSHLDKVNFSYVGRISEQKNLHTLIWGISLLSKEVLVKLHFNFFGGEDHLGSPNMGKKSSDYLQDLKKLVHDLNLSDVITFHGQVERSLLYDKYLKDDHVFISPSLHSDENFGMAALGSLQMNRHAILSRWGGHAEFEHHFPHQIEYLPVYKTEYGPVISPVDIKRAIQQVMSLQAVNMKNSLIDSTFVQTQIKKKQKEFFESKPVSYNNIPLKLSDSYTQYCTLTDPLDRLSKTFKNYADPIAQKFFHAYGMTTPLISNSNEKLVVAPWVRNDPFCDPHRGEIVIDKDNIKQLQSLGLAWKSK